VSYENFYAGSQNPEDVEILESVLKLYSGRSCRFLEIGVLTGQTARGIKQFCDENGVALDYWGIDPVSPEKYDKPREPFQGAHFIQGDSAESFHLVPENLDVVLSDGCHCVNHVILETLHYGAKVDENGFMLFHDTNPAIQQTMRDPHGSDIPQFYNSVLEAHRILEFPRYPWSFYGHRSESGRPWGGITAYRKFK